MFWVLPGTLIYEITTHINADMEVFGYLMTTLRCGKFIGHLVVLRFMASLPPHHCITVHAIGVVVLLLGIGVTPLCTSWMSLGVNWFVTGSSLAFIETNIAFFNGVVNGLQAPKFTNVYYCIFSLGAAIMPVVGKICKDLFPDANILALVAGIVVAIGLLLHGLFLALVITRWCSGVSLAKDLEDRLGEHSLPSQFNYPVISGVLLGLTSFLFMAGRNSLEVFILPFAIHSGLDEYASYVALQAIFLSSLVFRILAVPIAMIFTKITKLMLLCNLTLAVAITSFLLTQDKSYTGIIVTMALMGITLAFFQNTLLNWMTSKIQVNQRNSAPFFLCNCLASTITPGVVPHIILDSVGDVKTGTYVWLVACLMGFSVVTSCLLMLIERGSSRRVVALNRKVSEKSLTWSRTGTPTSAVLGL
eukprot:sb/3465075/